MSDLFGNHIVGFPTRRLICCISTDQSVTQWYLPEVLRNTTLCDVCGIECGCQFDPNKVPEVSTAINNAVDAS